MMGWACITHGGDEIYLLVVKPGRNRQYDGPISILDNNIKVTLKK